jgi:hypothetical protein
MFVELVRIESLSNNSYVVGSEESGSAPSSTQPGT